MRALISLLIVLIAVPTSTIAADNTAQSAVRYECTQIKPAITGFSCSLDKMGQYGMQIHFLEDPQKMTKERRAASAYQGNKMIVRFYQVGGSTVTKTAEYWGKDKAKKCHPTKSRQGEVCFACLGKDEHGNWKCQG